MSLLQDSQRRHPLHVGDLCAQSVRRDETQSGRVAAVDEAAEFILVFIAPRRLHKPLASAIPTAEYLDGSAVEVTSAHVSDQGRLPADELSADGRLATARGADDAEVQRRRRR